jgi:hypothetical protein
MAMAPDKTIDDFIAHLRRIDTVLDVQKIAQIPRLCKQRALALSGSTLVRPPAAAPSV